MPGDSMELSVDFRTQRAVQNAQALNDQIDKMATSTANTARVVYTLDVAADKLAESERKAADQAGKMADNVNKAGDAAKKTKNDVSDLEDNVKKSGKAYDELSRQVLNWIGSYAGIHGVMKLLNDFNQQQLKILENQGKFATVGLSRDQILENVQRNLNLPFTEGGQATARRLVEGVADRSKLSFENAAAVVSATNAAGFKPLTPIGAQTSEMVAKFAALGGLQGGQIEGLARVISNQGLQQSPAGTQAFLGKLYQTFTKTDTTSFGAFIDQAIPALNVGREKGMNQNEILGLLSAYMSTAASPEQGGDRLRMMMRMGEAATPKVAAFMAAKAREAGLTHPGTVTMADVEAMAANNDQDKRGKLERIRDMESGLGGMDISIADQTAKIEKLEGTRARTPKAEEQRQENIREAKERLSEANRRKAERLHDIELARQAAVSEVQAERDIAAFNAVPVSARVRLLQNVFRGVKGDTTARSQLIQGMGGRGQIVDAVEAASGVVFAEKQATATAAASDPSAGDRLAREMVNRSMGTVATASAVNEQIARMEAEAGGPSEQFASQAMAVSDAAYSIQLQEHGKGDQILGPAGGKGLGIAFTDTAEKARYFRASAADYLDRLDSMLTVDERKTYGPMIQKLKQQVYDAGAILTGAGQLGEVNMAMRAAGTIRNEVISSRRKLGGKSGGKSGDISDLKVRAVDPFKTQILDPESAPNNVQPAPATSPTTQPTIHEGFGTALGVNYNINVGNYFSTSGADAPLAGRLEGLS